jgi:2-oxoglutarate ferredoxin oxidoreductase subunit alpha
MALSLMEGNEAVARGAMAAGCRFFAGYPITPATTILNTMLTLLPPLGGVCLQAEDEIASIGACLGASMAGLKVMTATSGPGISLYSEHISFAVGSEIPIVIVDVQRLGPSTGSATRGADGDINFLRWGSSGGMPVIVLAPVNTADCFTLTIHAFNLAEQFRCPVFIASNKEIAMTRESVDLDALERPTLVDRTRAAEDVTFLPFQIHANRHVPDFLPIGGTTPVRQTSSTHGANGYITIDQDEIGRMQQRLKSKLEAAVNEFSYYEFLPADRADTLLVSYGVTARAVKAVYQNLKDTNRPVAALILKTLWPVPAEVIQRAAKEVSRVVVVEMNLGQYVLEIQRILADRRVDFYGEMDGRLIPPDKIKENLING